MTGAFRLQNLIGKKPKTQNKTSLFWPTVMGSIQSTEFWETVQLYQLTHYKATTVYGFQPKTPHVLKQ